MATKPETKLRNKIVKAIREKYGEDVWIFHPHGGPFGHGAIDLIVCLRGWFVGLEVKTPGSTGGMTPSQQSRRRAIVAAGGNCEEVRTVAQALGVLGALED